MKSKTFSSLQNVFLPPSKDYLEKESFYIPNEKNKDICYYDPRCIMSSGFDG